MKARPAVFFAALLCIVLTSCSPSAYDSAWRGGTEADRIDADSFLITAKVDGYTLEKDVKTYSADYALIKAAETAVANNRSQFVVTDTTVRIIKRDLGYTQVITKVTVSLDNGDKGDAPAGKRFVASDVLGRLGPKYLDQDQ